MAVGDDAAAAGLAVVSSGASLNQGYNDINQKGDELAAVMARTKTLETRTAGRVRAWKFERVSGNALDSFSAGSFAGLISGTITSAPAGDYWITVTLPLGASQAAVSNIRLTANASGISEDVRHDLDTAVRTFTYTTALPAYAGGNLTVAVAVQVSGPTSISGSVVTNGAQISVAYLGAR